MKNDFVFTWFDLKFIELSDQIRKNFWLIGLMIVWIEDCVLNVKFWDLGLVIEYCIKKCLKVKGSLIFYEGLFENLSLIFFWFSDYLMNGCWCLFDDWSRLEFIYREEIL